MDANSYDVARFFAWSSSTSLSVIARWVLYSSILASCTLTFSNLTSYSLNRSTSAFASVLQKIRLSCYTGSQGLFPVLSPSAEIRPPTYLLVSWSPLPSMLHPSAVLLARLEYKVDVACHLPQWWFGYIVQSDAYGLCFSKGPVWSDGSLISSISIGELVIVSGTSEDGVTGSSVSATALPSLSPYDRSSLHRCTTLPSLLGFLFASSFWRVVKSHLRSLLSLRFFLLSMLLFLGFLHPPQFFCGTPHLCHIQLRWLGGWLLGWCHFFGIGILKVLHRCPNEVLKTLCCMTQTISTLVWLYIDSLFV